MSFHDYISSHQLPPLVDAVGTPRCRGPSTLLPPLRMTTLNPELTPFLPPPGNSSLGFLPFLIGLSSSASLSCESASWDSSSRFRFSLPLFILALNASVVGRIDCSHAVLCSRYSAIVALASVTYKVCQLVSLSFDHRSEAYRTVSGLLNLESELHDCEFA